MPVYKLTPIDLNHPSWKSNKLVKYCIVRARTPEKARDAAAAEFKTAAEQEYIGQPIPLSPWQDPEIVECVEMHDITPDLSLEADGIVVVPDDES